ncbi:MGDG synthase family glycosyltransferase [Carnobacterium inhibens]|uniref:Diacylglycerol glucosyltransferase n=1 Tax=Carnobacterium inhibens subsp. gilichinskyi TaxID=1266845 RepID=U5S7N5_9LACT|nr:glycosyltransferase [Carnobacterium inhibens]AGY81215.1 diacylglycerol glucosyltransferase [Carnobacterium inhibens subsp. gilichinskyi]
MSASPKILILTGSYGNGHLEVTHSLITELNKRGITNIVTSDLFYEAHPILTNVTRKLYIKSFTKGQNIYGYLYYKSDFRLTDFRIDRMIDRYGYMRISQLMKENDFDLVINTFPMQALPIYKQRTKRIKPVIPFINVLTDFCLHTRWISDGIDYFFVACDSLKKELVDTGIAENKITISGIPIKEEFYLLDNSTSKEDIISENTKKLLISAGAHGVLKDLAQIIEELKIKEDLQITVVCGSNKPLFKELMQAYQYDDNIKILGYVSNMANLMSRSDIMVTKAGGISLSEALAIRIPLILTPAVPGQEHDNANFFEQEGMAIVTKTEDEIVPAVLALLKQPLLAKSLTKQMEKHFHPHASALIVDKVLTLIEKPQIYKEKRHDSKEIKS